MDTPQFEIVTDLDRKLMLIRFTSVFWDMAVAVRFKQECQAAIAALQCTPGAHLVLVDLRNAVLQSKDVYEKMQHLIGSASAARIALVASSPLARMQTKRLQLRDNIVMFADMADARAWLFAGNEAQAA